MAQTTATHLQCVVSFFGRVDRLGSVPQWISCSTYLILYQLTANLFSNASVSNVKLPLLRRNEHTGETMGFCCRVAKASTSLVNNLSNCLGSFCSAWRWVGQKFIWSREWSVGIHFKNSRMTSSPELYEGNLSCALWPCYEKGAPIDQGVSHGPSSQFSPWRTSILHVQRDDCSGNQLQYVVTMLDVFDYSLWEDDDVIQIHHNESPVDWWWNNVHRALKDPVRISTSEWHAVNLVYPMNWIKCSFVEMRVFYLFLSRARIR